jgi:excisionase family DNA binding protein
MSNTIDPEKDELITTRQAANLLQTHVSTIYRWILSGKLPAWRRGGRHVVKKADLLAMLVPVIPEKDRPKELPTAKEQRAADKWTQEMLRRAGWVK